MQIDQAGARVHINETQMTLLLDSAVAHAQAILYAGRHTGDAQARAAMLQHYLQPAGTNSPAWFFVYDSRGELAGRYSLSLEDEAAKADLNSAFNLAPSPGSGWSPGEINLPVAVGLQPAICRHIVNFRYGPNHVPGARGDDDANNLFLINDGIDNNANGVIDEADEGIDDPGEYCPHALRGDDRVFSGMNEVVHVVREAGGASPAVAARLRRELPRRATLHALAQPPSGPRGPVINDLNALSVRDARRLVSRANRTMPFGANQPVLNQLAVNIVDYRDQNHVLSTHAAQYGVEAVNFNEVLANDGTLAYNTAPATVSHAAVTDRDFMVPHYAMWNHEGDAWQLDKGRWAYATGGNYSPWDIEVLDRNRVRLLGPAIRFTTPSSGGYFMDSRRQAVYNRYRDLRRGSEFPPSSVSAERNGYRYTYDSLTWPENLFKNASVILVQTRPNSLTALDGNSPRVQDIRSSTRDGVLTLSSPITFDYTTNLTRGLVFGWAGSGYAFCAQPRVPLMLTFQGLQPRKYYLPIANNWSSHTSPHRVARAGFAPLGSLSQDDRRPTGHKIIYGGDTTESCEPVRSTSRGVLHVHYISGSDTRFNPSLGYSAWNTVWGVSFMRPEVLELYNASTRAVSLRDWTLTFNSGSVVNDIGLITSARGYSLRPGKPDGNPVIQPNNFFYLVSNVKLFNAEFGSGSPSAEWGANAAQNIPIWEIPNSAWGVQYEIEKAATVGSRPFDIRVNVKNERWRPNQFRGEVVEFVNTTHPEERKGCAHGCRYMVVENTRNTLTLDINAVDPTDATHYEPSGYVGSGAGVNRVMMLGMPAKGGVVSMTLKNEYKQITARTIDYAYLDREPDEWYGASAEKRDPTRYEWIVRNKPSINGRPEQAINVMQRSRTARTAMIKNGPYVSAGELRHVRSGEEFQTLGSSHAPGRQSPLAALAAHADTAAIRLEACDPQAERTGWRAAVDSVRRAQGTAIMAEHGGWENSQWRQQSLRFLSGPLYGECFRITDNASSTLRMADPGDSSIPRSAPNRKPLQPARGDQFALGPGYLSPLCYTRTPGEHGTWLWKQCIAFPGSYHLYLYGLNDAIATTEFLEENNNAALDIYVWNWPREQFDQLARNVRYDKSDCIHAGVIAPAHISPRGDFKLQLTARDVAARGLEPNTDVPGQAGATRKTGFAWFNYAMITPVPVPGRINVNTAPERLLQSLPGITPTLARNIALGRAASQRSIKPYHSHSDLLRVDGMTPELFERIANIVTYGSCTYTVETCAQVLGRSAGTNIPARASVPVEATRTVRYVMRSVADSGCVRIRERSQP